MKQLLILLIGFYRFLISPILVSLFGHGCRYHPTCSQYAKQVLDKYGVIKGGSLTLKRIISCHPYSKKRNYDPIPNIL